jgi:ADP-ribosylglycohydrolase
MRNSLLEYYHQRKSKLLFSFKSSRFDYFTEVVKFFCSILVLSCFLVNYTFGQVNLRSKISGLVYGTVIGDAMGGPIEFQGIEWVQQTPNPPKLWKEGEKMNDEEQKKAMERIYLRPYTYMIPSPASYGQWTLNAEPGTITDDTRNKIVLMSMLRKKSKLANKAFGEADMAQAYLDWGNSKTIRTHAGYDTMSQQWLTEITKSINWLQGKRLTKIALPPQRMWNGLPTCWGQMTMTPLAAMYLGDTTAAYLKAYEIAFFDNGFARDMNAALVAGLAKGLTLDPAKHSNAELWKEVIETMKNTDPYKYNQVPWCPRAISKWLILADTFANQANGCPQTLWQRLEKELYYNEKWEAHVPVVVCFSILKLCNYDPLAAFQLCLEWGWDTDTYPQLLGAFIGAIYGEEIFKEDWKKTVSLRMKLDYDENLEEWTEVLTKMANK